MSKVINWTQYFMGVARSPVITSGASWYAAARRISPKG